MDLKSKGKKTFKLTRELIRLALKDGWTQSEIAGACRTQQSIVSGWKKGSKQGTEQQLSPLLKLYGHKLRRNTFKVYWSLNTETEDKKFYRVEGKVILSQVFSDARRDNRGKPIKKVPQFKLVIHHQGDDKFRPICQTRIKFDNTREEVENSVEDAIWVSEIGERISAKEAIEFVEKYAKERLQEYPGDACTLPFLIRQSLLNHGFPVDGVVDYPAVW